MKLLFVADAGSPIARAWIGHFAAAGHEVHVLSTYPVAEGPPGVRSLEVVPVAFAGVSRHDGAERRPGAVSRLLRRVAGGVATHALPALNRARNWIGPVELRRHVPAVRRLVRGLGPDLVHAMRIPFEGVLAARAVAHERVRLVVSIWGNDFTLHAGSSPMLAADTRATMRRADGVHPDCFRDLDLAKRWGFGEARPSLVIPTNGGVDRVTFRPGAPDPALLARWGLPAGVPVVLNPRGVRPYVRNDVFFGAIPIVAARRDVVFVGLAMAGNSWAEAQARRLGDRAAVRLLPPLPPDQVAHLFRAATVTVSPTEHDGTPNTLLEAMACGAFPIAGGIESVREWITDGENGLLCDPADARSLADAIDRSLGDEGLRVRACRLNAEIVGARADRALLLGRAEAFYRTVIGGSDAA